MEILAHDPVAAGLGDTNGHPHTPLRAIRLKCLDCSCDQPKEVRLCPCTDCALYPFRFGKNPYRAKRELTDEQRRDIAMRLARGREVTHAL